jgi:hypothetical protein
MPFRRRRSWLRAAYLGVTDGTYSWRWALSHLVLAAIFYGAIAPIGLILRLFRHDPLARRFDPKLTSYWLRRGSPPPPESYFRQS